MNPYIKTIDGTVTPEEVEQILSPMASGWTPRVEEKIYYPYFWYHLQCRVSTPLGKSLLPISCLIDSRTKIAATTDPFVVRKVKVTTSARLRSQLSEPEAYCIAKKYAAYWMRRFQKAWFTPNMEVLEQEVVYKPFWIVKCDSGKEKLNFRVLVDGVTGAVLPMG